ncbi:MAG TPA: LssY C-terminal domain-containing protein [Bryobacteraceae bacterium]|nr:LssY C-terminal domain-containing protein [Bryobacteraceae bacterium]
MIGTLFSVLLSIATLTIRPLPEGTPLHIRLTCTVGSYASTPGSPVTAVLIAPVKLDGETMLPAGSALSGTVKSVTRVGFGLRHETAGLDLVFSQITPPEGKTIPISARVTEVDNGRERVTRDGRIQGVRSTGSISYRVSGYIRTMLQWEFHAALADWAIRSLLMELPEPEIYYPAGVELTLALSQPLFTSAHPSPGEPDSSLLSYGEREDLSDIVSRLPYRTRAPISGRPSDLTNVLVIGSHDEIVTAFDAAGWSQPTPTTLRGRISFIRAVAELRGDEAAPMSLLLLDGSQPDMSWQKGLNDVAKRHHIRLWRGSDTWHGKEVWIGAATRDVDFEYLRPGKAVSHRIAEDIDQERDKVAYDLAFTSCGSIVDWTDRLDFPRFAHNATGDPIATDGRMAVVELMGCPEPRLWNETTDSEPVPEHGGKMQRFARREILSARNELLRTNPYWRTFEASRWIVESIRQHKRRTTEDPEMVPSPFTVLDPPVHIAAARTP